MLFKKEIEPMARLVATVEDQQTGQFEAIIKFRDIEGELRKISVPRSVLEHPKQLDERLTNAGAKLPAKGEGTLAGSLIEDRVQHWKRVANLGWSEDLTYFAEPRAVLGASPADETLKPPVSIRREYRTRRRGNLKQWKTKVAARVEKSSLMVFGICTALAASLLKVAGLHSFGINAYGPSKAGKSTALLVASSVIGLGAEDQLPTFNATDAALIELPWHFRDRLLPINELGTLKGSKNDRHSRMNALSYNLAEGRDIARSRLAGVSSTSVSTRCIALATGEEPLDHIAEAAGQMRMAGASVRFIDLPAILPNYTDIFDHMPMVETEMERREGAARFCKQMRDACSENHGTAHRHFVKKLLRRSMNQTRTEIKSLTDNFCTIVHRSADGSVEQHLAQCFGHVYASGVIGVRFGTLPWAEKFVLECVERCYVAARDRLRTEGVMLSEATSTLRKKLKELRSAGNTSERVHNQDGFSRKLRKHRQYTIRADAFRSWFSDSRHALVILQWLHSKGALSNRAGTHSSGQSTLWAERQVVWPDGSRPRSIVINEVKGLFS